MLGKIRSLVKNACIYSNPPGLNLAMDMYNRYRKKRFINFRQYDRQHKLISKGLSKEFNKVLSFGNDYEFWTYAQKFEKRFSRVLGMKYARGMASGTAALQLSLTALGIGRDDEVITVPYTYIATALAIANSGAKPVFVDIDEKMFNIDTEKIEDAITANTKAIMPVHLHGQCADMGCLKKIAKKHGLFIIEDACQAFGAEYHGKKAGTMGDAGCFSFFTGKNLGGFGNGGMAVSNSINLIKQIDLLRDPEDETGFVIGSKRTPC